MQAKRIQVFEFDVGVDSLVEVILTPPTDPREEINYHNIWASLSVEPVVAGANAQGNWVLFVRRAGQISVTFTDANINNETQNQFIIACGVWGAANEMPYNQVVNPKTSRTLAVGDQLVIQAVATGISSGNASVKLMLCAHTTRK